MIQNKYREKRYLVNQVKVLDTIPVRIPLTAMNQQFGQVD